MENPRIELLAFHSTPSFGYEAALPLLGFDRSPREKSHELALGDDAVTECPSDASSDAELVEESSPRRRTSSLTTQSLCLATADSHSAGPRRSEPGSPVSDLGRGYRSRLPRQAPLPLELLTRRSVEDVSCGTAGLRDGAYLFVVTVGRPDVLRLLHEDIVQQHNYQVGHSSLLTLREFTRFWAQAHRAGDPQGYRRTVLYAGELLYREGAGVVWWNNCSGHYKPDSEDHDVVGLDPERFMPVTQLEAPEGLS